MGLECTNQSIAAIQHVKVDLKLEMINPEMVDNVGLKEDLNNLPQAVIDFRDLINILEGIDVLPVAEEAEAPE